MEWKSETKQQRNNNNNERTRSTWYILHWKQATHSEEQREAFTQLCMRPDHVAVGISL